MNPPLELGQRAVLVLASCALAFSAPALASARLAGVFGDHMVLQRGLPIPVWGTAQPGEVVRVSLNGPQRVARADPNGRWRLHLPAAPAGGPHTLRVQATNEIHLKDVFVGDVWLCSGQSNMEWTVAQSAQASSELAAADHPLIRHVKIPHRTALQPEVDLPAVPWRVSSPATTGEFSAAAYFFALRLQREWAAQGKPVVPIGLVNATWGGSHIETWTSGQALRTDPVLAGVVQHMPRDNEGFLKAAATKALGAVKRFQGPLPPLDETPEQAGSDPALDDRAWPQLKAPQLWEEQSLPLFDGTVWYRRQVDLSPEQANGPATLHLGLVDDCDETWVNGQRIGGLCGWDTPRHYSLPAGVLRAGSNLIAVRVVDTGGGGGFHGSAESLALETGAGNVALSGPWKARIAAPLVRQQPGMNDLPTLLFNGMVRPLTELRLRGVLWYQGESNVPRAARYEADLKRLIADWRTQWRQPTLPFLYVQLAAFLPLKDNSLQGSDWAELREAQRRVLAVPGTGMVVATDIGDANDIHPRNKRAVGDRLAGLALRQVYGGPEAGATGPVLRRVQHAPQGRVILHFAGLGLPPNTGLAVRGGGAQVQGFSVAGADRQFVPAQAEVQGNQVKVWSDAVPAPEAVRYGWVNNPERSNLINRGGLPASPFRTDRWPLLTQGGLPPFE